MANLIGGTLAIVLMILLICLGPLVLFASLNTIFEQANIGIYIPHNIWTYLSGWGIILVFGASK